MVLVHQDFSDTRSNKLVYNFGTKQEVMARAILMHWVYSFLSGALTSNFPKVHMFRRLVNVLPSEALAIISDLVLFSWNLGGVPFKEARRFKCVVKPQTSFLFIKGQRDVLKPTFRGE